MMVFDLDRGLKESAQKLDALAADRDILPEIQSRASALAAHSRRLAKAFRGSRSVGRRNLQMLIDTNRSAQAVFGDAARWCEIVYRLLGDAGVDEPTEAMLDQAYREWLVYRLGTY